MAALTHHLTGQGTDCQRKVRAPRVNRLVGVFCLQIRKWWCSCCLLVSSPLPLKNVCVSELCIATTVQCGTTVLTVLSRSARCTHCVGCTVEGSGGWGESEMKGALGCLRLCGCDCDARREEKGH